ncbi:brain-specific angiogenesis inhibitor 1-associated protein 2-like isoform X3 [Varanus komodoensis]|uniref:brain-specific angiogenesis inhibitor 1-associated protein 2-like isoform X3 n=1 Tax=Varanus komodoensis TaxID=61221 RepID=UPI001CF7771F|nr:brain-specific angiogenesis inhibitor 1-associated protein 2-like isoform X3 [Varanus komodoensis]
MSRSEEVNRLTENVYRAILDQFNPSLRNFVTMGKNYQKALSGVTVAAKGYFDALVKLGELASDSQGSKELGDTLFQMAEVHRQIQVQLEETLKLFHSELLSQLEHKLELDIKYLMATLKKYQVEHRAKAESIEKCQAELKKLRKKCQNSKNPQKYGDREVQYVEIMSTKQSELDQFVAEGYKAALTEERRRYSFLVDRQCAVSKHFSNYHTKVRELLATKLPIWQSSCTQPTRLPERVLALVKLTANNPSGGAPMPTPDALPGSKVVEELSELGPNHRTSIQEVTPLPNGDSHRGRGSRDLGHAPVSEPNTITSGLPPTQTTQTPPQTKTADSYSCTLPMPRKMSMETRLATLVENKTLPRISPLSVLPPRSERRRVQAIFSHAAGENSTLLNFQEGDVILLLVTEARDGWHYGENEATKMKGWFPFSYTRPFPTAEGADKPFSSGFPLSKLNSSSTGNLDRAGSPPAGPEAGDSARYRPSPRALASHQRPYSMINPDLSQLANEFGSPTASPSRTNPFAHIKLKRTVTNDRSAPLIQ